MAGLLVLLSVLQPSFCQRPLQPDLPSPRIVILGATGSGKSSLANAFLGCDPRAPSGDCMFEVCNGLDSCTKETTYGFGSWLGTGQNFTVVDTPGFGDSDNDDEKLIEEMMDILANKLDHADTLLLLLDGREARFNSGLQTMLKRMTIMFGQDWWDYVVIGASFWAFSQEAIDARECFPEYPEYCKDEAWFIREITAQLKEKLHVERNFTFVFTDSWSQTPGPPGLNTEDPFQQEHWQKETTILWDITIDREGDFGFMDIDDILEENDKQRAEIKWLNDVITNNISKLAALINDNTVNLGITTGKVHSNEADIGTLQDEVSDLSMAPVGTISAWVTKPAEGGEAIDLPDGWVRCDGSTIPHPSIWAGMTTPNLNGEKRFLRGGGDGDALRTEEDQMQEHKHEVIDPGHKHEVTDPGHDHGVTDNGHDHTVTDPKHDHGVTDPGHNHGVTDGGHKHGYDDKYSSWGKEGDDGYDGPAHSDQNYDRFDASHDATSENTKTGITIKEDTTGLSVDEVSTGISVNTAYSSLTVKEATTRLSVDGASTGLHVAGVSSSYRKGTETRPKNMSVVYIMKVW